MDTKEGERGVGCQEYSDGYCDGLNWVPSRDSAECWNHNLYEMVFGDETFGSLSSLDQVTRVGPS